MNVTDEAHRIHEQSFILNEGIETALRNLDDSLAGWPAQTPGASPATAAGDVECPHPDCANSRPCPVHGGAQLAPLDRALTDLEQLKKLIKDINRKVKIAASITDRWAHPALDGTTVKQRLAAADDLIWCKNCSNHGFKNVKEHDRDVCTFCSDVRAKYGMLPPKDLLDIKSSRRVYVQDITRCLDRARARIAEERRQRKADEKAERDAIQ